MKLAEKLEYLQTNHMSMWLTTRDKVFEELSNKRDYLSRGTMPKELVDDLAKIMLSKL